MSGITVVIGSKFLDGSLQNMHRLQGLPFSTVWYLLELKLFLHVLDTFRDAYFFVKTVTNQMYNIFYNKIN